MQIVENVVMRGINDIVPYEKNPRKNSKTVELLCKVIPKVGFNVPLVIDKDGVIVKGHARYGAAIRLGMETVPCIVTHADPEAIKADRITDNKISEFSEWINDEVLQEIQSIDTDIDFSELGFPSVSFSEMPSEGLKRDFEAVSGDSGISGLPETKSASKGKIKAKYYKCVCPDCGHVMFVREDKIEK